MRNVAEGVSPSHSSYLSLPVGPKVLSVRQFHAAIGAVIGINTLYEYARSGRIRSVRIGRKLLILASEVDEFFEREATLN